MKYKIMMKNNSYVELDIMGDIDAYGAGQICFTFYNSLGQKSGSNITEFVIGGEYKQPIINYGILGELIWNGRCWQVPLKVSLDEYKEEIQMVMNKWWKLRAFG